MRQTILSLILPAVCLLLVGPLCAQGRDDQNSQQPPFRVEVDAVNVLVAAHDSKTRKFVTDLNYRDFEIYEDGVRQEITNFSQETDLPLTIALCVDTSSSVKLKLEFEKQAAIDFLYSVMRPIDRALLVEFDTGVTLLHDFTSNPNDLVREIESLKAGGGTSLYDAVHLVSEQKMLYEAGRKIVVILSDGADLTSKRNFEEMLRMAYQAEIAVYAISTTHFGAEIDHEGDNALRQLTEATGGRTFFAYSTEQLNEAFQEIDQELRSQYNVAYVPSNRKRDGSFREIKVKLDRGGTRIAHRKGYYAARQSGS